LRREQWSDAAAFQGCVMRLLDVVNQHQPVPADVRRDLYSALAGNIQPLADRHRDLDANLSERYEQYVNQLREMAYQAM
jgi:hypothetical protein